MYEIDWTDFRDGLTEWYRPERRPMPWKQEGDPYRIWLSEIILQQTRVEQGLPYYQRFLLAYPTVTRLAAAPDDEVMKLWEGLGYYSRARNLLRAARYVAHDLQGNFPDTYDGLKELAGVGPYTAAAIASFAFGRQLAVLDGNVFRVLARYADDVTPIDTAAGRHHFQQLADVAMSATVAATFNQAIMDFGALVCKPKRADCKCCPLAGSCRALATGRVYDVPHKSKRLIRRNRFFHYLVITDRGGRKIIVQRSGKDIWEGLYEYPLIEAVSSELGRAEVDGHSNWPGWLPAGELEWVSRSKVFKHQLTHQRIAVVFHCFYWSKPKVPPAPYRWVSRQESEEYAFPRVITRYNEDIRLTLGF